MLSSFRLMSIALSGAVALGALPVYVPLYNAANPGMSYPTMGLGTAGGSDSSKSFGQYSECWASCNDPECTQPKTTGSCAQYTIAATTMYIQLSARLGFNLTRVDSANTYRNGDAVAKAIRLSGVPRSQIFFQSKIGPDLALGTAAVWNQTYTLNNVTQTYTDNLMLHWPTCETGNGCGPSIEPACNHGSPTYNATLCMLVSYSALVDVWKAGLTRSVGVSNFNISHLEAIKAAGLPLPALNQISYHLYHSVSERALLAYCIANKIAVNSWTPLARSDDWVFQPPCASSPVLDTTAAAIGAAHGVTGPQVQLAWQVAAGVYPNPRTQNAAHALDNLSIFNIALTADDIAKLDGATQALCSTPACTNPVLTNGCPNNAK